MKKSMKAALWSGLAFPGIGHFFLKRYFRGMMIFAPALVGALLMARGLLDQVDYAMSKIESGAAAPDAQAVTDLLSAAPDTPTMTIALWIFVIFWGVGIVDAYLLGSAQDRDDAAGGKEQ